MLREYEALDRWRERVRAAFVEHQDRCRALDAWSERERRHFAAAWKRQKKGKSEPTEPPGEGWTWGVMTIFEDRGKQGVNVAAWVPPDLNPENRPRTGPRLPLPAAECLSLAASYAVLAAIHDRTLRGVEHIDPWKAAGEQTPGYYLALLDSVPQVPADQRASLEAISERVKADLASKRPEERPAGSSKVDNTGMAESDNGLTVTQAARIAGVNSGLISRAADEEKLKNNGKKGRQRRIDRTDFTRWMQDRTNNPEPKESAAAVEKKTKKLISDWVPPRSK